MLMWMTRPVCAGFVSWFDLTLPLSLRRADWVVSLEVGEHVPNAHEGMVVRNLHAHNCFGVLLSWAALGQVGHQHVNNHRQAYVVETLEGLGYFYDEPRSQAMRANMTLPWLRKNLMLFRRWRRVTGC